MTNFVLSETRELKTISKQKKYVGILSLNRPKALNALNIEMILSLQEKLMEWEKDPSIALIILDSTGDKAFCAGGDVRALGEYIKKHPSGPHTHIDTFFLEEFFMDCYIHKMKTPTLSWADRIVMGGGMGIVAGMDFCVVTERSVLAMPEITIGYFPDVGASYFLNKMPGKLGLYLALTGMRIQGVDAFSLGFANFLLHSSNKELVFKELYEMEWENSTEKNKEKIKDLLLLHSEKEVHSPFLSRKEEVNKVLCGSTLDEIQENILSLKDSFFEASKEIFSKGSPSSKALIFEQMRRGKSMSLAECFAMEWALAANIARSPDFFEGIRALLIDKDKSPNWSTLHTGNLESFFKLPMGYEENPLKKKLHSISY